MPPAGSVRTIALRDDRSLDVYLSGPEDGVPFVFHHGTPGAGTPYPELEQATAARGFRYVAITRPGYGGSTRRPGRRVVDIVDDTKAVLAQLGADRCVVGGWSGGGPHALACAARLDGAVAALAIASIGPYGEPDLDWLAGMGADNLEEFGATLEGEDTLRAYLDAQRPALVEIRGEDITTALSTLLPEPDRAVLSGSQGDRLATNMHEALRVSVDGWLDDDLAFAQPWGFELGEIGIPTFLWQGSEDLMVPFAHGQWFAKHLPNATVHLEEGEGHLSLGVNARERMLDEITAAIA